MHVGAELGNNQPVEKGKWPPHLVEENRITYHPVTPKEGFEKAEVIE